MKKRAPGKVSRDPFSHLHDERAEAEEGEPWFVGDDDGPELHIETNRSSNLTAEDLGSDASGGSDGSDGSGSSE